jgi:hypothetical protein
LTHQTLGGSEGAAATGKTPARHGSHEGARLAGGDASRSPQPSLLFLFVKMGRYSTEYSIDKNRSGRIRLSFIFSRTDLTARRAAFH